PGAARRPPTGGFRAWGGPARWLCPRALRAAPPTGGFRAWGGPARSCHRPCAQGEGGVVDEPVQQGGDDADDDRDEPQEVVRACGVVGDGAQPDAKEAADLVT